MAHAHAVPADAQPGKEVTKPTSQTGGRRVIRRTGDPQDLTIPPARTVEASDALWPTRALMASKLM
jgi:hypothetical protein